MDCKGCSFFSPLGCWVARGMKSRLIMQKNGRSFVSARGTCWVVMATLTHFIDGYWCDSQLLIHWKFMRWNPPPLVFHLCKPNRVETIGSKAKATKRTSNLVMGSLIGGKWRKTGENIKIRYLCFAGVSLTAWLGQFRILHIDQTLYWVNTGEPNRCKSLLNLLVGHTYSLREVSSIRLIGDR